VENFGRLYGSNQPISAHFTAFNSSDQLQRKRSSIFQEARFKHSPCWPWPIDRRTGWIRPCGIRSRRSSRCRPLAINGPASRPSRPGVTPSPGSERCCRNRIGSRRLPKASKTGCGCWMASLSPPAIATAIRRAHRGSTTAAQPDGFGRLQSEQALLHARAITEWIRAALASRR